MPNNGEKGIMKDENIEKGMRIMMLMFYVHAKEQ